MRIGDKVTNKRFVTKRDKVFHPKWMKGNIEQLVLDDYRHLICVPHDHGTPDKHDNERDN